MNTKQLRQKILDLAIRGKLVPQNPEDEPVRVFLERILAEKRSDKEKKEKHLLPIVERELPFNVPEGWTWCRLGHISSNIQYGLSNSAELSGNYRLLRITDIQDNKVEWDNVPFTTITDEQAKDFMLEIGDIVFARTGATVGKSFLISTLPFRSVFASYLIKVKTTQVSPQYIKHFFDSHIYWEQITDKSVGIGQPNVNGTKLKELVVPLPPLAEQQRIVAAIESAFTVIDEIERDKADLQSAVVMAKQKILSLAIRGKLVPQDSGDEPAEFLLEQSRQYKERLIEEGKVPKPKKNESPLLSVSENEVPFLLPKNWKWCRLGDVCAMVRGNGLTKRDFTDSGVGCIHYGQIYTHYGNYTYDTISYVREEVAAKLKKVTTGEIIITITSENVEDICKCVAYLGTNEIVTGAHAAIIKHCINSMFLVYCTQSNLFYTQKEEFARGFKVTEISTSKLKNFLFPLPPLAEQKRIVAAIEAAFEQLDCIAKNISN